LPKVDGLQLARELVATLQRKPLMIAVTGYADNRTEVEAREAGFDCLLAKPVDPLVIGNLIRIHARGRLSE